jgi:hypothetical protein
MSNEAEKDPQQQKPQQGQQDPVGSANPSQGSNRPQDISKKNPSQDSDSQHKGQEKPEDEKRRAS